MGKVSLDLCLCSEKGWQSKIYSPCSFKGAQFVMCVFRCCVFQQWETQALYLSVCVCVVTVGQCSSHALQTSHVYNQSCCPVADEAPEWLAPPRGCWDGRWLSEQALQRWLSQALRVRSLPGRNPPSAYAACAAFLLFILSSRRFYCLSNGTVELPFAGVCMSYASHVLILSSSPCQLIHLAGPGSDPCYCCCEGNLITLLHLIDRHFIWNKCKASYSSLPHSFTVMGGGLCHLFIWVNCTNYSFVFIALLVKQ